MTSSSRQFENADSLIEPEPLQTPGYRQFQPEYVIHTKLQVPQRRVASNEIERTRLLDLLDQYTQRRVTLVRAPVGYGKSSLVADWARRTDRSVGWLTLDSRDNNSYRFLLYLRTVLEEITEQPPGTRVALGPQLPLDLELDALVSATGLLDEPATLVLDDLHTISDPVVLETLEYLIAFAGFQLSFILISRSMPPIAWSRWQLRDEFTELGSSDLQFTASELTELFASISASPPPPSQIKAMLAMTDGWIAAVQLLTRLSGDGAIAEIPADLTDRIVSSDVLMNYLVDEVLNQQPSERLDFLQRIALSERICGSLAEKLTGVRDSQTELLAVEAAGLFLTPLSPDREWFQLHPIFREVLLRQFHHQKPETEIRRMHVTASRWFEEAGHPGEAIHHAVAARDWDAAIDHLVPLATTMITQGLAEQIVSWLEQIPQEIVDGSPELALSFVSAVADSSNTLPKQDPVSALIARNRSTWSQNPDPDIRAKGWLLDARLALNSGDWRSSIDFSRQVLEDIEIRNADLNLLARYQVFRSLWMTGKPLRTLQFIQELRSYIDDHDSVTSRSADLMLLLSLGRLQGELGDLQQSQTLLENLYQQHADDNAMLRVVASKWLGWIAYVQNDLDRCQKWLFNIADSEFRGSLTRFEPRWHLLRGRLLAALRNTVGARDALDEAVSVAKFRDDPRWLRPTRAIYARFALNMKDGETVEEWVRTTSQPGTFSSDVIDVQDSMTFAHVFVSLGQYLNALDILRPLTSQAAFDGRLWDEIDGELLIARTLAEVGEQRKSISHLNHAVSLARPNNAIRPFLDAGEIILDLLAELPREGPNGDHIERILQTETPIASDDIAYDYPVDALTPRELQVLRLISLGLTNQAIGERIGIAESTVKRHVSNMLIKLEASNRTEALHRARQLQILSD